MCATSKSVTVWILLALSISLCGCDASIFPIWPANFFAEPPAELGPLAVTEYRINVADGADGQPAGITVFAPEGATEALPALVWVLGSNVQAYYQQSLHETMASWGYAVIVPDGRPLTLTDFQYHRRNVDLARQAIDLALDGGLDVPVDPDRIGIGGYSIGGTMATFVAAEDSRVDALALWAPSDAPFWTGINPEPLWPQVTAPAFMLLAEFDTVAPPDGFPSVLREKLSGAAVSEYVIPEGLHLYFQQPTGADSGLDPETTITRFEQQGIAIERTRAYLDEQFRIVRE